MVRYIRGSSDISGSLWNEHNNLNNGGGCLRQRRTVWRTDDNEKPLAVNNVITLNNFVTPTTDMEMRIRVE
eukprot:13887168-Heterocapsa_arctica.AAC.1